MLQSLQFDPADGRRWVIRAVDERAAVVVEELGRVMRLGPGDGGRELTVAVGGEPDRSGAASGGVLCRLDVPTNRETQVRQMRRIASMIAREAMVWGGLLFHGALAEYRGSGFLMAGPGCIGKSTASRRLPLPWRSLSDDMSLVVRDGKGRLWAHPWPTWSSLWHDRPEATWAVEQAIPLRAVFFLDQAPVDRVEPVNATQATAMILESAEELVHEVKFVVEDVDAGWTLSSEVLGVARELARAVPAFSLQVSLGGRFWEHIEKVLPVGPAPGGDEGRGDWKPVSVESLMARDSLRVVCTGNSMEPTFRDSDLLEVRPYGSRRVRRGDVVCFKSPDKGETVVHRVVSVGGRASGNGGRAAEKPEARNQIPERGAAGGIRTRGDNNPKDDPWVLHGADIIGRVEAAQRGARRRIVPGGWKGSMTLFWARSSRGIRRGAGPIPHRLYNLLAGIGPFDRLLPARLRPRLVRFGTPYQVFLKLLMGRHTVGQCDRRFERWQIRRPFRLFVDERALEVASLVFRRERPD